MPRGLERNAEQYAYADPSVAERAAGFDHLASLPTDTEIEALGLHRGPGITAGTLLREAVERPTFERGTRIAQSYVTLADFDQLGMPLDAGLKELSNRYPTADLRKAFLQGVKESKKTGQKDLYELEGKYEAKYGQDWVDAFCDGWEIVAARY